MTAWAFTFGTGIARDEPNQKGERSDGEPRLHVLSNALLMGSDAQLTLGDRKIVGDSRTLLDAEDAIRIDHVLVPASPEPAVRREA